MKSAVAFANVRLSLVTYLLLALVSIWWAGSYLLIRIAIVDIPPATLATARLFIASTVLLFWLKLSDASLPARLDSWTGYAGVALLGHALPLYLIAWASTTVPVGEMAILVATTPLFAVLFAHVSRRERPTSATVLGLLAGVFGLAAFLSHSGVSILHLNISAAPRLALLGAAASYALSGRAVARLRKENALVTGTAVMICAVPMLLPLSLCFERPWAINPTAQVLGAVMLLGVMSTAVAYVLYYRLIELSGPAFASLHHYLVPALSVVIAALFLNERMDLKQLAFMTPIVASVVISRGLISRKL